MRTPLLAAFLLAATAPLAAQTPAPRVYTHADSLRGALASPGRSWWDVTFYDLHVRISPVDSSIRGWNAITYRVTGAGRELQVDLMTPLEVDSVLQGGRRSAYRRDGNAFFVTPAPATVGTSATVVVYYHGAPRPAARPPWEGGYSWKTDSLGRPWIVTTDQGVGASIWWPNKDSQADEPDSQRVALTVPGDLVEVSNGRLRSTTHNADGTTTYEWFVTSPINNYAIAVAAGHYTHYSDVYQGIRGPLTLDFWPLDYHLDAAARSLGTLVVERSPARTPRVGERLPLRASNSMGRDAGNDIALPDEAASARHATLEMQDGEWFIEDLGSTNGTLVNGVRIERRERVRPGDEIAIGRIALRLDK